MSDPAAKTTESMSRVRFKSIRNLVMAGYQGWFNTPEDGAGLGWKHFEKEKEFKPGKCTIDLWPDVSEYEKRLLSYLMRHQQRFLVRMMLLLQICILNG